jgi:hypothetical protein
MDKLELMDGLKEESGLSKSKATEVVDVFSDEKYNIWA